MQTAEKPPREKKRVSSVLSQMEVMQFPADEPAVTWLVQQYRDKYNLGPRNIETEKATRWLGAVYENKVVAVFGDREANRAVEVTDAYFDGSKVGKMAFAAIAYAYYNSLQNGEIDVLQHSILYENKDHWLAVWRDTGDAPDHVTFVHRRKES
jgi:lauroyl/myristoyl acyltransferase